MANNISIGQALNALAPNCNFGVGDEDINQIHWVEGNPLPQPSNEDIIAKQAELQIEYDAKEYQRQREFKYPTWQEQMDMQYHDEVNGTTTWKDAIAKVKSDNPKSED